MASVTTVSPTIDTRDHRPGVDRRDQRSNLSGAVDLATVGGWSVVSTFVVGGLDLDYDGSGPAVDIGAGRVARQAPGGGQELVAIDAESGVSLDTATTHYLFFTGADEFDVRDADEPPDARSLLFGIIDTDADTTTTSTRGRSPVSQFLGLGGESSSVQFGNASNPSVLEAEDMADGTTRRFREFVPSGKTLELLSIGVIESGVSGSVTGLTAKVVDASGPTDLYSTENKRDDGTPLLAVDGGADLEMQLDNATGSTQTGVAGRWVYRLVELSTPPTAVFALGGYDDTITDLDSVEKWDGSSWSSLSSMPTKLTNHGASVTDAGNVLVIGGRDSNGNRVDSVAEWDGSSWSSVSSLSVPRGQHAATIDDSGTIYAIAGEDDAGNRLASVETYDGSSWSSISSLSQTRVDLAATVDANGNVYALGGFDSDGNELDTVEKWDGNSWSTITSMNKKRGLLGATVDSNGDIYAIAGTTGSSTFTTSVEKWDGSSWSSVASLNRARRGHAATVDKDGNLYAIGGYGSTFDEMDSVEQFDGSNWSGISNMSKHRNKVAAAGQPYQLLF